MSVIALVLTVLMQLQIPLFLVALLCGLGAPYLAQSGDLRKARWAAAAGFGASSLLAVLYVGSIILSLRSGAVGRIGLDVLMACLWGFFAWRDYRMLQQFKGVR